jgi:hypothetical protein
MCTVKAILPSTSGTVRRQGDLRRDRHAGTGVRSFQLQSFLIGYKQVNGLLVGFPMEPELITICKHHLQHLMVAFFRNSALFGCGFDVVACPGSDRGPVRTAFYVSKVERVEREAHKALDCDIRKSQSSELKRRSQFVDRAADISPDRDHIEAGAWGYCLSQRNDQEKEENSQTFESSRMHASEFNLNFCQASARLPVSPCCITDHW